jgi:hypothetical protein
MKMPSDWVFIAISLFSLAGIYAITQTNLRNYMKKRNFDLQLSAEKLKLKKLESDLGLKNKKTSVVQPSSPTLLEQLSSIDLDKIKPLLNMLQKTDNEYEYNEEKLDPLREVGAFLQDNPGMVQGFLDGLKKGGGSPSRPSDTKGGESNLLFD